MNPFKRVSPYTLLLSCLGICILFSGCAVQLTSVPRPEPHGTLTVSREEKDPMMASLGEKFIGSEWDVGYKSIWVKVDDKAVFKDIKGKSATFLIAPGKHDVEAGYHKETGSGYNVTYYKTVPVMTGVVTVKEKGTASIRVFSDGEKISLRILPRPEMGSGSVIGVLKDKETGKPLEYATILLLKVISTDGGQVTLEVGVSSDGKILGNMTTKTDGYGSFRFDAVAKGTPYVLGAVDNTGETVLVILSADDNVKDLGIVYQKKQSDKQKVGKEEERFIAYKNGTVLDTKTNLMWAAKDNGNDINWANAKSYCENYRGGGYTDWRMPTQDELSGLYNANKSRPGACHYKYNIHVATELIDITCFIPWASETRGSDAAYFNFGNGERYWGPQFYASNWRALPVRSGK